MLYRKYTKLMFITLLSTVLVTSTPVGIANALSIDKALIEAGSPNYDPSASSCNEQEQPDTPPASADLPASTSATLDKAGVKDKFTANAARYQYAEQQTGVPAQVVAALHFREGGMDPGKSISNGQPLGSGKNVDGVIIPADPNEDAKNAANIFKNNAKKVYDVEITSTSTTEDLGKAFVAYNRGFMYKNWNAPWNLSPYAMNGFDDDHLGMKWIDADSYTKPGGTKLNSISGKVDGNVGALAVAQYLGGLSLASVDSCASGDGTPAAATGNVIETAKSLAWPKPVSNGTTQKSQATPAYQAAMPKYNGSTGSNEWSDCGVFVSTVMHMSGADNDFPKRGTSVMMEYLVNSPKYSVKEHPKLQDLQPGDILVKDGHIMFYAGELAPGLTGIDASLGQRVPSYRSSGDIAWMLGQPGVIAATLKQGS